MFDIGWAYSPAHDMRLGVFVGYHYWREKVTAYGLVCNQASILGCPSPGAVIGRSTRRSADLSPPCMPCASASRAKYSIDRHWSVNGEIAAIPYAALRNSDSHLLRQSPSDLGPAPNIISTSNYAYGVEAEAVRQLRRDAEHRDRRRVCAIGAWPLAMAASASGPPSPPTIPEQFRPAAVRRPAASQRQVLTATDRCAARIAGTRPGALNHRHERPSRRQPEDRPRAAQPDRRRRRRQRRQGAPRPRRGGSAGRRSRGVSRAVPRRLSAGGPRAQAGVPGRLPRGGRGAGARDAPTAARRCWSARPGSRTASSTTPYALLDGGAIEALRFKVDLPNYGVFDEKRVFAPGPLPGPIAVQAACASACRSARTSGAPRSSSAWRDRRRDPAGAERLALLARQDRACGSTSRWRAWSRAAAAGLPQPGRRPGRTGLRRRLVRAQRRPQRSACSCRPSRETRGAHRLEARGRRLALRQRAGHARMDENDEADYGACVLGLRDYVEKNGFPGVVLGLSGGIDSALVRRDGGRCAGRRPRALRHAALSLHLAATVADRRRGLRQGARRALRHRADRDRGRGLGDGAGAGCSRAAPRDVTEENMQAARAARS